MSSATSPMPIQRTRLLISKTMPKLQQNVAAILRNSEGEILICERVNPRGAWQFPQGGVDEGETSEEAIARELWEEIGIGSDDFRIVKKLGGYQYLFPSGRKKGH